MQAYSLGQFIKYHAELIGDRDRVERYRQAIRSIVKRDDVVLDIGTGTGILAFLACQAGAKKVYAVDKDHRAIELARYLCTANGLQDRVVFLDGASYDAELSERADVLIAGNLHNFGLEAGMLSSINDARMRLLKKYAAVIPESVELTAVPVELLNVYEHFDIWNDNSFGIDFSLTRDYAINSGYKVTLSSDCFLGNPELLARIHFGEQMGAYFSGRLSCVATRTGVLHGIGGWFRAKLAADVSLSNDPSMRSAHWSQVFLPIETPVLLHAGDIVNATISTHDGADWRWQVEVHTRSQVSGGPVPQKILFDHSTFFAFPLRMKHLLKQSQAYKPQLSEKGEAEAYLLGLLTGKQTIAQIEKALLDRFSGYFHSARTASDFVREIVARCT